MYPEMFSSGLCSKIENTCKESYGRDLVEMEVEVREAAPSWCLIVFTL